MFVGVISVYLLISRLHWFCTCLIYLCLKMYLVFGESGFQCMLVCVFELEWFFSVYWFFVDICFHSIFQSHFSDFAVFNTKTTVSRFGAVGFVTDFAAVNNLFCCYFRGVFCVFTPLSVFFCKYFSIISYFDHVLILCLCTSYMFEDFYMFSGNGSSVLFSFSVFWWWLYHCCY